MTQAQFEKALAEEVGLSRKDVQEVLDSAADVLRSSLKKGEPVTVRSLGKWSIQSRKARMGRNPQTGEAIKIKASKKLKVLPASQMRQALKVK